MPEGRPEQWLVDLTDRAAYLRGRYLTSYAQCEFLLADLSVKVDNRFRYAIDKRINAAKAMADSNGPLNRYADDFVPLIKSIVTWSERRHWFAHGFMTLFGTQRDSICLSFAGTRSGAANLSFANGSRPSTIWRTLRPPSIDIAKPSCRCMRGYISN